MLHRTSFQTYVFAGGEDLQFSHSMPNGGRITVVDRMTGFGWRDIETGYRCPSGQFWLASGGHDIRNHLHELDSDEAMTEWVIKRANNCTGSNHPKRVGLSLQQLLARDNWRPSTSAQSGGEG